MNTRLAIGAAGGDTNSPLTVISNSGGRRCFIPETWRAVGSGSSPVQPESPGVPPRAIIG
jgi:hypothetical protein